MTLTAFRTFLGASTVLASAFIALPAMAQVETVTVTGSRIHRDGKDTTTSQPVSVVTDQAITDRGFTNAAQAVRDMPQAVSSATPLSPNNGSAAGVNGAQYIDLFNLGPGRTLTLLNGRRFVSSAPPNGGSNPTLDNKVDPSLIPIGLLSRIEIVEAGGSAVYGSDAIAGVVNYVLNDHFEGIEFDGQAGQSTYGDYPVRAARLTAGIDFLEGKGNIAVNFEFSESGSLLNTDRPESSTAMHLVVANTDFVNPHFWEFNNNGIPFIGVPDGPVGPPTTGWQVPPVPIGAPFCGNPPGNPPPQICFVYDPAGTPLQFGPGGLLQPYDVGATPLGIPFTSGGQGFPYANLASLYASVKRQVGNAIAHYDINDHMKLSGEFLYARVDGNAPFSLAASNAIISPAPAQGIWFNATDARLPAATQGYLIGYLLAHGLPPVWPMFLSKSWDNLTTSTANRTQTDTLRGVLSLDGDFSWDNRDMYWSISGSYGRTKGEERSFGVDLARFEGMIGAPLYPSGYNAQGHPTGTLGPFFQFPPCVGPHAFAGCTPLNPFDPAAVTDAQRELLTVVLGDDYTNEQTDFLATLGGTLFDLSAGGVKFSLAYEHRSESASFVPTLASQLGLDIQAAGIGTLPSSGSYHTDELWGEVDVPIVAASQGITFIHSLDVNGALRWVHNSIAGSNTAWDLGLRWAPAEGVTFRGTLSSNFRAPSLTQVFLPTTAGFTFAVTDPCSRDNLFLGPNPAARLAHCQADWAANADYGGNPLATVPGGPGFQDINENVPGVAFVNGGNPALENEISRTKTIGIILEPTFAPGLTIVADHIQVDVSNGFVPFDMPTLLSICYDSPTVPAACAAGALFTRDPLSGNVVTGNTLTAVNAAHIRFKGQTFNVGYTFPLEALSGAPGWGDVDLNLQATHVDEVSTTFIAGGTPTRTDGTRNQPHWVMKFDAHYTIEQFRFNYSLNYLGTAYRIDQQSTTPATLYPKLSSNTKHNASVQYDVTEELTLRAGVNNFTNERPSFPSINYGDIIGRQYYVGLNAHLD